jgi:hypothetical protein
MNMRLKIALAAWLAFVSFAMPATVLSDPGHGLEAKAVAVQPSLQSLPACPGLLEQRLNIAQTSPYECCKDHKGVCGCRAGKIICCDGTTSTEPGCTCHGDDGFLE